MLEYFWTYWQKEKKNVVLKSYSFKIFIATLEFPQVKHKYWAVRGTCAHFVALRIPADLKDAAGAAITMNQLSRLCAPNVHALVETARSEEFSIRTKRNRIDWLRMLRERVNWRAAFDIPQANGRVETRRGENQIHVGIVGAWTSWRPLDGVDFLRVSLEIMHVAVVVHRPNLERHIIGAGGQKCALRVPLDGVDFVLWKNNSYESRLKTNMPENSPNVQRKS